MHGADGIAAVGDVFDLPHLAQPCFAAVVRCFLIHVRGACSAVGGAHVQLAVVVLNAVHAVGDRNIYLAGGGVCY